MRYLYILLLFVLTISIVETAEPFPIANELFREVKTNPTKWNGQLLAFEGKVITLRAVSGERPYFKIIMSQPILEELWVGMLFKLGAGRGLEEGDVVRVLGFYTAVEKDDPANELNSTGHHLLGFCVVNLSKSEFYFFPPGINDCEEWENGIIQSANDDGT